MISRNVARRYAKALLELGVESGSLKTFVDETSRAAEAYQESAELRAALDNPLVAHAAKKAILTEVAEGLGLSTILKNTLLLLGDRRRLHALPAIAQVLREMSDLREGVVRAEVITAARLNDDYYNRLRAQLEKLTGKVVVIDRRQDPSLIAGVITRIGDMVIDGSLRARLHELRNALLPN
jgi:F-type H+-transporting ATPase subunit delta